MALAALTHHPSQLPITLPNPYQGSINPSKTLSSPPPQSCCSMMQAKQIHGFTLRQGLQVEEELFLYSKILVFCTSRHPSAAKGGLDYANLIFQQLQLQQKTNTFMWNTMIRTHANNTHNPVEAILLYNQMRCHMVQPNSYTFTFLVKACSGSPVGIILGRAIHGQTIVLGLPRSDAFVGTSLIDMYMAGGHIEMARRVFDRMQRRTSATWNAMITGYAKCGDVESARLLFDEMPEEDVVGSLSDQLAVKTLPTWNAMVAGYIKGSRAVEAVKLFRKMQHSGVSPDEITVVSVLPGCAQIGALELGEWLHAYADKKGYTRNIAVSNTLIDMYAKCGSIGKAMCVFERMRERDLVSWNTMISGLAIHGKGEEAIKLFEEMESKAVWPDRITFVGLLSACGHAGLVDQAEFYFKTMQCVYGIEPKIEHYGCMVDVLGSARQLGEVLSLIDRMPFEPNSIILGSLLGACKVSNNFQVGERLLEKLKDMDTHNSGYYVLLSNMYACTGQWKEVIRIRKLMKHRGIEKTPGSSSIEVDNVVHEFVAGDKTHPMTQDIHAILDQVLRELRLVGYTPDTSVVLFDAPVRIR